MIEPQAGLHASTPDAHLICALIRSALQREEEEIRQLDPREPIDRYLCSVSFADEVAIVYLLRKQALRCGIPMICERRPDKGQAAVDLCFPEDGTFAAFCEIKTFHIGYVDEIREALQKDVCKALKLKCPDAPCAKGYNAWIVASESAATPALKLWVENEIKPVPKEGTSMGTCGWSCSARTREQRSRTQTAGRAAIRSRRKNSADRC